MGFCQRQITRFLHKVSLNYEVHGSENLDRVREFLGEGKIIAAILDHKSYADFFSGAAVVVKEGIQDLVSRARVVMSAKYKDKLLTRSGISAITGALGLEVLWVVSHTMENDDREGTINTEAVGGVQDEEDGKIDIITPEGTRSDGEMKPARWGSANFWHGRGERYILPIAIEGSEKQWPRGMGSFVYYWRKGRKEHQIKVIFGEPIPVEYLDRVAETYAQGNPEKLKSLRVDIPMLLIAQLHQDPKYKGTYYVQLKDDLDAREISQGLRNLRNIFLPK